MQNPILVPPLSSLKPADRNANKPVYIVSVENPEVKNNIQYYKATSLTKNQYGVDIRGNELTKAQAEKIRNEVNAKEAGREINHEIPWQRVIRIENVTYKPQIKENKNDK